MKFRVSPQAFFQVNTLGAEVLYKTAIDLAELTPDTALLDVCCGTGTIGLCFSKVESIVTDYCQKAKRSMIFVIAALR
jgi:tRNA/tmRNA/rRNA uracil-C5-methylase (TrmA/RlmC/RlmD family)